MQYNITIRAGKTRTLQYKITIRINKTMQMIHKITETKLILLIHDHSLSSLGTYTSIKSGGIGT